MAQDRGRWSEQGGERRDYETDDLRFRGVERGQESRRGYGQQRGEAFSRGLSGESTDGDYDSGQQSSDWFGGRSDEMSSGYGHGQGQRGGYDSQTGSSGRGRGYAGGGMGSRDLGTENYGRFYGGETGRGGGYGQGGGSYPNSRQGRPASGRQGGHDAHERGFMDKAGDEVASWFGNEEAEQRRRQDQHHRGRGPRGYARSDERIKEDVNDRLTDDWMLDASDIDVEVSGREVTLSGEVSSRADKRRAEDIAEEVSGVSHVQNNLRVKKNDEGGGVTGVTL